MTGKALVVKVEDKDKERESIILRQLRLEQGNDPGRWENESLN
jgi:hypothetical protein